MNIERKPDILVKRLDMLSPDEFVELEEYIEYLTHQKEDLTEEFPEYRLLIDYMGGWDTDELDYFIKVVREETDSEMKTRVNDLIIQQERQIKMRQEEDLRKLKELQEKYGEIK